MAYCIPKHISKKLLEAAKNGEINIVQLYNMESVDRRSFFETYTSKENAEGINAGFESAMAAKQKDSLAKWADSVFNPADKKKGKGKDVVDRINDLKAEDLIGENSEGFYQDLIASKLGVSVSEEEMRTITKMAENLEKLYENKHEKFGLPSIEYFVEKERMQRYLYSLVPTSELKVASSTIARGTLLLSFKSPLTNVVGNTVQGLVQSMEKRLASGQYTGSNPELVKEYVKYVNEVYKKSGYDVTRAITLAEDSKLIGEEVTHSEGKGAVRAVGRWYEDWVFKKMLGAPDVAFSAMAFSDSADLMSTKIANKEGLKGKEAKARAAEIFKDAMTIEPKTFDGELVRAEAMSDAMVATFTNDSTYSTFALGIRKLFNLASGDLRVGDQIMPFVKTPANVIGSGLDAAGLSAIMATYNLPGAISEMKDGNLVPMKNVVRGYVRSGLGMTLAFILSSLFDPDDFIGEYPTTEKERQLLELQNATPNSIRIGDKWVSLDYFGPIGAPLVGMLYAKKYGKNLPDAAFRYSQGVATQSTKIPGFNQFYDTVKALKDARPDTSKPLAENLSGMGVSAVDFIRSRVVPAIVYDIAKGTDTFERKVDYKNPTDKLKSALPGLRQQLPVDKTVLGEERKTEGLLSTLLFGSRLKTARQGEVVSELERLDSTGNLPSITDVEKTSTRVKSFKTQVEPKVFREAMDTFGTEFGQQTNKLMQKNSYKKADDEKRAKLINEVKEKQLDKILKKYKYKKPKKK